jgi:anti-sigma-K factor RskA
MIPAINSQLFRSATAKHRRTDTGRGLFLDTWLWRWALVEGIITMVVFLLLQYMFSFLYMDQRRSDKIARLVTVDR